MSGRKVAARERIVGIFLGKNKQPVNAKMGGVSTLFSCFLLINKMNLKGISYKAAAIGFIVER
mgnify:CR=1 FL=1|jgi:hypothetical protein